MLATVFFLEFLQIVVLLLVIYPAQWAWLVGMTTALAHQKLFFISLEGKILISL